MNGVVLLGRDPCGLCSQETSAILGLVGVFWNWEIRRVQLVNRRLRGVEITHANT